MNPAASGHRSQGRSENFPENTETHRILFLPPCLSLTLAHITSMRSKHSRKYIFRLMMIQTYDIRITHGRAEYILAAAPRARREREREKKEEETRPRAFVLHRHTHTYTLSQSAHRGKLANAIHYTLPSISVYAAWLSI